MSSTSSVRTSRERESISKMRSSPGVAGDTTRRRSGSGTAQASGGAHSTPRVPYRHGGRPSLTRARGIPGTGGQARGRGSGKSGVVAALQSLEGRAAVAVIDDEERLRVEDLP